MPPWPLHQLAEHVAARTRYLLEPGQRLARRSACRALNSLDRRDLLALLGIGGADQLPVLVAGRSLRAEERVHADDREGAVVLERLVVEALVLDLAALVHRVHRPEHAAPLRQALELRVDRLLDQVCQLVDDERALPRVLAPVQPELMVDDQLDRDRTPHRLLRRRRDRLVVRVRVEAVAVVEERVERLEGRPDVVELDLLRVQAPTRRLDVVLEHLASRAGAVALPHRAGPDAARNPADDRVLGSIPLRRRS